MKITESRLRQLIRSVIKENYNSVPTTPGIYTNHGKHIAGKLWDLLGCREEASEWLATKFGKDSKSYNILLNKVVFGNYGPMRGSQYEKDYAYKAGIYYGGYDWNNTSVGIDEITEDPILKSKAAVRIVNEMMDYLDVNTVALSRRFEGKHMYEELANTNNVAFASQGPGKPPKYAYASQDAKIPPKQLIRQKNKSNCHVLVMYVKGDINNLLEFEKDTGMKIKSPKYDGNYVVFFLFFKDNECVGYYSEPYSDVSRAEFIAHDWVKNCSTDSFIYNNLIKPANQSNAKRFIALQNSSEKSYISYGKSNQAYYTINQTR